MPERRIGRGYDSENDAEWRVEAWTGPGGLGDWRSIERGNRLTRRQLRRADHVVISYTQTDPDGQISTEYRTFRGPVTDVDRVIQYWKAENSL